MAVTSRQLSLTCPAVMTRIPRLLLLLLSLALVTAHLSPLTHQETDTDYRYQQ